jgi:hypothetical protein
MFEPIYRLDYESISPEFKAQENNMATETIVHNGLTLAIIIWHNFSKQGIHFVTPDDLPQQVAYMRHPAGKQIQPHIHNPVKREVQGSQEVLLIKSGKLRVDFYTQAQQYISNRVLSAGDVIILIGGGHGFSVLEEIEMIEIKQGPYMGDQERTQFPKSSPELFVISE